MSKVKKAKPIIGWREWISLPDLDLGSKMIKAKVDTGARSSSLHAFDLSFFKRNRKEYVKFTVCPNQRDHKSVVTTTARVLEYRNIKSSNGSISKRPVIVTNIELLDQTWPIELTLSNRDEMGFRMLLGRETFKDRMLVDAGKSFYSKKPKRKIRKNLSTVTKKKSKKK